MARTELTVQPIVRSGLNPALSAANVDGHSILNDGRVYIEINNAGAGAITVTVQTPNVVDGDLLISDRQVNVPIGEVRKIGPFSPGDYNQADRTFYVDFSAVAGVTVGAFRL